MFDANAVGEVRRSGVQEMIVDIIVRERLVLVLLTGSRARSSCCISYGELFGSRGAEV